jgi:hypothetical protein
MVSTVDTAHLGWVGVKALKVVQVAVHPTLAAVDELKPVVPDSSSTAAGLHPVQVQHSMALPGDGTLAHVSEFSQVLTGHACTFAELAAVEGGKHCNNALGTQAWDVSLRRSTGIPMVSNSSSGCVGHGGPRV